MLVHDVGEVSAKRGPLAVRVAAIVGVGALILAGADCSAFGLAPADSDKPVPCTSDVECEQAAGAYKYCLHAKCVECLTSTSCGGDNVCSEGRCYVACKNDKACPPNSPCTNGFCSRP